MLKNLAKMKTTLGYFVLRVKSSLKLIERVNSSISNCLETQGQIVCELLISRSGF